MTDSALRSFGLMMAGFLAGLFGLALPLLGHKAIPTWPYIAATLFFIPSLVKPSLLKGVYHLWMKIGHVLGFINTRIILTVLFYGLITPIGLIVRLCGYNALEPTLNKHAKSYFHRVEHRDPQHMEKPF